MIRKKVKKISLELERLAKYNIPIERALDLIEASTKNLEELLAINTMRECMKEIAPNTNDMMILHPAFLQKSTKTDVVYH
jgi:hypothetical protein